MDFGEGLGLVGDKIEHAIADDDIKGVVFKGHGFNVALHKLNVSYSGFAEILPGFQNHGLGEIQSRYPATFSGLPAGYKTVVASPAAQIEHGIALLDGRKRGGYSTSPVQVGGLQVADLFAIVFTENAVIGRLATRRFAAAAFLSPCNMSVPLLYH